MLKTSEGIIIKTVKYSESSVILDIFSKDLGVKSYIVSGVRGKKKGNRSARVSVLNLVKYVAYEKHNDKLSRIKEIDYNYIYKSIPFNVVKGSVATFLIEVCRKSLKADDSSEEIYNHIVKGLIHLDNLEVGIAHFHIQFLIDLAEKLGFQLGDNYTGTQKFFDLRDGAFRSDVQDHRYVLDAELSRYMYAYIRKTTLSINKKSRLRLLQELVKYYQYHIPGFGELKSLPVLQALYN